MVSSSLEHHMQFLNNITLHTTEFTNLCQLKKLLVKHIIQLAQDRQKISNISTIAIPLISLNSVWKSKKIIDTLRASYLWNGTSIFPLHINQGGDHLFRCFLLTPTFGLCKEGTTLTNSCFSLNICQDPLYTFHKKVTRTLSTDGVNLIVNLPICLCF